jgi:hypothetical protein
MLLTTERCSNDISTPNTPAIVCFARFLSLLYVLIRVQSWPLQRQACTTVYKAALIWLRFVHARPSRKPKSQKIAISVTSPPNPKALFLPATPLRRYKSQKIALSVTSPSVPNGFVFSNRPHPRTEISKNRPTCRFPADPQAPLFDKHTISEIQIAKNRDICHLTAAPSTRAMPSTPLIVRCGFPVIQRGSQHDAH